MSLFCCDERRREAVRGHATLNGIDFLEVLDRAAPSDDLRQRTLYLHLLADNPAIDVDNVRIDGGERIRTIAIEWVSLASDPLPAGEDPVLVADLTHPARVLLIRVASPGDFSIYTLRLVDAGTDEPLTGFDPRLASIPFSFKVECDSPFDCRPPAACLPVEPIAPAIDYLAKDYATFRRLMLDRLATLAPDWRERHAADAGVALIELLAYVGDQLSYQQDAIATEAYLRTARRRVSVRRHARLVDYVMHDGCAARVLVQIEVNLDGTRVPAGTPLLTRVPDAGPRIPPASSALDRALETATAFETMEEIVGYVDHNRLELYAWGDERCCLPAGTTRATLKGHVQTLKAGDVLVFVEELSPTTGKAQDADRTRRVAVRLTHVERREDPAGGRFLDPPTDDAVDVTEIVWADEDALPVPICLSAITDVDHGSVPLPVVSAAFGNIVLADHGRTIEAEPLGTVPPSTRLPDLSHAACDRPDPIVRPPRFRPRLREGPVTQAVPLDLTAVFATATDAALVTDLDAGQFTSLLHDWLASHGVTFTGTRVSVQGADGAWSLSDGIGAWMVRGQDGELRVFKLPPPASRILDVDPHATRPRVELTGTLHSTPITWKPQADLLGSDAGAEEFVVEVENDGRATIRFGDDEHGRRPEADTAFTATYRIGNGSAGNVGAEAIAHVVTIDAGIDGVTNWLPARGGHEPETLEEARRDAPEAFRVQERAVTRDDYARMAQRHAGVQRAAGTFRWTGSWHTVFVTVDRLGGLPVDQAFETDMRAHLERYRMAGYDLEVDEPRYVSLEIAMSICVKADYFRAAVQRALAEVFSRRVLSDGRRGLFHPDAFSFGQPVFMSTLLAAAQAVDGVEAARVTLFQRRGLPGTQGIETGVLPMGRLEVARVDNDPNFPERGTFALSLGGGK